jgi:FkbM family methyltransferase
MKLRETKRAFEQGAFAKAEYIGRMHAIHESLFDYGEFIKDTDIQEIVIRGDSLRFLTRSGIWLLGDPHDERIIPIEIINFGSYEKECLEMMLKLIDDGDSVFDIGANVGWYSINIARAKAGVKINAFEPIPRTFDYLRRNLELNGSSSVAIHNRGLSDAAGDLVFYYYPEGSGNASMADLTHSAGVQKIVSPVDTLDRFVAERAARVDFIKCDVEGAELKVFKGAREVLSSHRPAIFTEMLRKWSIPFGYHPNDIISLLGEMRYRCFTIHGARLVEFLRMDDATVETNFVFLHTDRHAERIRQLTS